LRINLEKQVFGDKKKKGEKEKKSMGRLLIAFVGSWKNH
jgi:hypothetical protein